MANTIDKSNTDRITIGTVRKKRHQLEYDIAQLVQDFQIETGVSLEDFVDLKTTGLTIDGHDKVTARVRIESLG